MKIKAFGSLFDVSSPDASVLKLNHGKLTLKLAESRETICNLDNAFDSLNADASHQDIMKPLTNAVLDGKNACLLRLCTKATEKSFSNDLENMCFESLWKNIEAMKSKKECLVTASYIFCNENKLTDLLNPHDRKMKVAKHPRFELYAEGLSEFVVQNYTQLINLFKEGKVANQKFARSSNGPSSVFTISLYQKSAGQLMGLKGHLRFVDVPSFYKSKKPEQFCALLDQKSGKMSTDEFAQYLTEVVGGNSVTHVQAMVSTDASSFGDSQMCLQYAELCRGISNKEDVNVDDSELVTKEIREQVTSLRDKLMEKSVSQETVKKFETLTNDLQLAKSLSWEQKIRMSAQFELERKANLSKKGLLETLDNDDKTTDKQLEAEQKQVTAEHNKKLKKLDELKKEIKKKTLEYSKKAEQAGGNENDIKQQVAEISALREKLSKESIEIAELKSRRKDIFETQARQKMNRVTDFHLLENIARHEGLQQEMHKQTIEEHKNLLEQEAERCSLDVSAERAELQIRSAAGHKMSAADVLKLSVNNAQHTADKKLAALQIQLLQQENKMLDEALKEVYTTFREQVSVSEARTSQVFKEYREYFDTQKFEIESRFRSLLEESIKDAIFLSARNNEMTMENQELRAECAKQKDTIASLSKK